jgi:hypothetical protein
MQPETIQQMITVTGPITVEVDGTSREITSENLHEESERQRRVLREGGSAEADHKEVIELIGDVLLDALSVGDRDDLIATALLAIESLDQRDMQVYHSDSDVQTFLEERNWAGLLTPVAETPTLSVIFANITGLKTSLVMQPDMNVAFSPSDDEGMIEGTLTIALNHEGSEGGDPFYEGFQRWWVDVLLPDEVELRESTAVMAEDPDASNGGAYVVNLEVGEREEIVLRFTMPETEQLLIRRQPGLLTMQGIVEFQACEDLVFEGDRDVIITFDSGCPAILLDETTDE